MTKQSIQEKLFINKEISRRLITSSGKTMPFIDIKIFANT